jgi:hypothetical protein
MANEGERVEGYYSGIHLDEIGETKRDTQWRVMEHIRVNYMFPN